MHDREIEALERWIAEQEHSADSAEVMPLVRRLERMGEDIAENNVQAFAGLATRMESEFAALADSSVARHAA